MMLFAESLEAIIIDFMWNHRGSARTSARTHTQNHIHTQMVKNEMKTQFISEADKHKIHKHFRILSWEVWCCRE